MSAMTGMDGTTQPVRRRHALLALLGVSGLGAAGIRGSARSPAETETLPAWIAASLCSSGTRSSPAQRKLAARRRLRLEEVALANAQAAPEVP